MTQYGVAVDRPIHSLTGSETRPGVGTHRWYFSVWRVLETLQETISGGLYIWCICGYPYMVCQRGIQGCRVVHMAPQKRRMVCKDLWGPQMGSQNRSISLYTGVSSYSQVVFWHAKMGPNHGFGDMSKIAIFGLFGGI